MAAAGRDRLLTLADIPALAGAILLGPACYIALASGSMIIADRSLDYGMLCALASVPLVALATNNRGRWTWPSLVAAVIFFLACFLWLLALVGVSGPGAEFRLRTELTPFLIIPFAAAAYLAARRWSRSGIYFCVALLAPPATIAIVHVVTHHLIDDEITATLAAGGTVRATSAPPWQPGGRQWSAVTSVPPLGLVGALSPRIRFRRGDEEWEWRYSRFQAERL
jgi:hypothetical protein